MSDDLEDAPRGLPSGYPELPEPWRRRLQRVEALSEQLVSRSRALRMIGFGALVLTLINVVFLVVGATELAYSSSSSYSEPDASFYLYLNVFLSVFTLFVLGVAETLRKASDSLFQEISDELQFFTGRSMLTIHEDLDPFLAPFRYRNRAFSNAAELPLVPGRYGVSVYSLVSLVILGLSILVFITLQNAAPAI